MIINRKQASYYILENPRIVFHPGNNVIPEALEKALSENSIHKSMLEAGIHEVVVKGKPKSKAIENAPKNTDEVAEVMKLNATQAKKFIENCMNYELLIKIQDKDKRGGIQRAIEAQLKKFELTEDEKERAGIK